MNVEILALVNKNPLKVTDNKIIALNSSFDKLENIKDLIPNYIDTVIHCGGLTKSSNIEDFYKVNFIGTRKMIEFFKRRKINIKHFIYISSISAAGPQKEKKPINEDDVCIPIQGYGESKLLAENEVKKLSGITNWTIIRPPFILGPYDYDTLYLFKKVKYGLKLYTGVKFFSFVYSEDIADIIVKMIGNNKSFGKTYFVCYPQYTSQINFLNTIAAFVNKNAKFVRVHPNILISISILPQLFLNKITPINRIKFKEIKLDYWLCSPEKIKNELSLECKTSFFDTVKKTYEWYKLNKLL